MDDKKPVNVIDAILSNKKTKDRLPIAAKQPIAMQAEALVRAIIFAIKNGMDPQSVVRQGSIVGDTSSARFDADESNLRRNSSVWRIGGLKRGAQITAKALPDYQSIAALYDAVALNPGIHPRKRIAEVIRQCTANGLSFKEKKIRRAISWHLKQKGQ